MSSKGNICKYCGKKSGSAGICAQCYNKLRVVRKLVNMLKPYRKQKEEVKK